MTSLSKHEILEADMKPLLLAEEMISGNESLFGDIFGSIGSGILSGASWVAGKAADGFSTAFSKANNALLQAYGSHKTKIAHLVGLTKDLEEVDVKLPKEFLSKVTSNGSKDDIMKSLELMISTMKQITEHCLELESYGSRELSILNKFKDIKKADDCIELLDNLDKLEYPILKLSVNNNSMSETNVLAGGKVFGFDKETLKYYIESKTVDSESEEQFYSKEESLRLFNKLNDLESVYKDISKANDKYVEYIKKSNTVVAQSFKHLESLKGEISNSLIKDLESRLEGNKRLFAFYSGFLPKVSIYLDDYVDNISSFFSKHLIN